MRKRGGSEKARGKERVCASIGIKRERERVREVGKNEIPWSNDS